MPFKGSKVWAIHIKVVQQHSGGKFFFRKHLQTTIQWGNTFQHSNTGAVEMNVISWWDPIHGMEAVFPDEVEIPSFRVLLELGEANGSKHVRPTELHQRKAPDNIVSQSVVSKRLKKAFNKMNRSRELKEVDLVLKRTSAKIPAGSGPKTVKGHML
jgi:hypothetical protein